MHEFNHNTTRYTLLRSLGACRRPQYQYDKEHIEGAVSIPMFRPVAGTDGWSRLKKVVMGSLAMAATGGAPPPPRRLL